MEIQKIKELARKLNLQNIYYGEIELKETGLSNLDYLYYILNEEYEKRKEKAKGKLYKKSKLPKLEFDIDKQTGVTSWQILELMKLNWLNEDGNLFLIGKSGSGKTALAAKIGKEATQNRKKVYYLDIDILLEIAKHRSNDNKLNAMFKYLLECDLIIIDEVMYLQPSEEELILLYKILIILNETRSIIVITTRPLSEWLGIAKDKHLMQNLIDRLSQNTQILNLNPIQQEVIDYTVVKKKI